MSREVLITGLGPVTALGVGIDALWTGMSQGRCAIGPIQAFDATGFDCHLGGEVPDIAVRDHVPKTYRKAIKVMARDIELAVVAADLAARDAGLMTKGLQNGDDTPCSYDSTRMGAQIGAGLIAADLDELASALAQAADDNGNFDIHQWGSQGMQHLTPLWLLKYLPNMLACHVTIIHDAQGPSNTITCGEASSGLSMGEAFRVIQRGAADVCFCGGTDAKINLMGFLRQLMTQRINTTSNDQPATAVRPFDQHAAGTIVAEGGGIAILESRETFDRRNAAGSQQPYARILGFAASQTVNRETRNLLPDPQGTGIAQAIQRAIRQAEITPEDVDVIVPTGLGLAGSDQPEAAALRSVFAGSLDKIPIVTSKSMIGNCCAGAGAVDLCLAAKILREQKLPAVINCDNPLPGLMARTAPSRDLDAKIALACSTGMGGQNAAFILQRVTG